MAEKGGLESNNLSMSNEEILNKVYILGYEYEQKYGSCPQCLIAAIKEVFNFVDDEVFKASYALQGGYASTGNGTCGALTGAAMVIGCKYGREYVNFSEKGYKECNKLVKSLHDRFVNEYGSCICNNVQEKIMGRSFNLWDQKEFQEYEAAGGHKDKCTDVVGKVAMWVTEILLNEEQIK